MAFVHVKAGPTDYAGIVSALSCMECFGTGFVWPAPSLQKVCSDCEGLGCDLDAEVEYSMSRSWRRSGAG